MLTHVTLIVAAALLHENRVLAAQRSYPPHLAGQWELPGGKVEPGEDPLHALHREIREELGIAVEVGEQLVGPLPGGDWPLGNGATMRVWFATPLSEPERREHQNLAWVGAGDIDALKWLGPDLPIIRKIRTVILSEG